MDPRRFDGLIQKLSGTLSRRSLVGGPLGAALLAAVGLGEDVQAKKGVHAKGKKHKAGAEACIATGKKCSSKKPRGRSGPHTKKPKRLSCNQCCQRRVITGASGMTLCYCAETGTACTETRECCDGLCQGSVCVPSGNVTPNPIPVPTGCTTVTGVAMGGSQANGSACTGGDPQACNSGYCLAGSGCQTCPTPCNVSGSQQCCGDSARCLDASGTVSTAGLCIQCCTSSGDVAPGGCPAGSDTETNAACCSSTCSNLAGVGNLGDCCAPTGTNPTRSGGQACSNAGGAPNASCCSGRCTGANPTTSLCTAT